jgi:plastocyanin
MKRVTTAGVTALGALALAVAILALLSGSTGQASAAAKPKTYTVTIEGMQFQPAELRVKPGDTVVWVNKDLFPHTVTSKTEVFDSLQIAAGKSWTYRTAGKGEFHYVCTLHPTMQGVLRVE